MKGTLRRLAALGRRDLTIELSYHFQLVLRFFTVLTSIALFFFLARVVNPDALGGYEGGYFAFVVVGLIVIAFSQAAVISLARSIEASQSAGTFEILLSTPTSLPTLMAGTLLVPLLFAAIDAALYLGSGWLLAGFAPKVPSLVLAGGLLLLTLGTFAALGILSASVIVLTKRGDPFSTVALQASNILAGTFFPISVLPEWLQALSHLVPAFYGLRGAREVLLADAGLDAVAGDFVILALFNVVLLPLSLLVLSRAIAIARVTGTLGNR